MAQFPRLTCVAAEQQQSPEYFFAGKQRQQETHVLFKYTLAGEGAFRYGKTTWRIGPETGFLTLISDPKNAYFYPPDASAPWDFIYLTFDGSTARAMTKEFVHRFGPVFPLPREHEWIQRLLSFSGLGMAERDIYPEEGASLIMDMFAALGKFTEHHQKPAAQRLLVRRAREIIADSLTDGIAVTELATRLAVSREHLTRIFREETGISPHVYVTRQRMLHACRLLQEKERLSIKEIAAQLNYTTPGHFCRTFKRVMHTTPSRFRAVGIAPGF